MLELNWPTYLLAGNAVWDIGQLSQADKRALDRLVRQGKATKSRALWPYRTSEVGPTRSLWELRRNPVQRRPDGYYALLPRRYSLRGARYWLGPFRTEERADTTAGLARRNWAKVEAQKVPEGWFVGLFGGWRLQGPPAIGPFDSAREAGSVLGKLQRSGWQPALARVTDVVQRGADTRKLLPQKPAYEKQKAAALSDEEQEAIGSLRSLGFSATDATQAVHGARARLGPSADAETLLRQAFKDAGQFKGARSRPQVGNPRRREQCPACGRRIRVPRTAVRLDCPGCGTGLEVS
mgnify:CR=1 FL=1